MVVEERVTSSSSGRKRRKYQTESNLDEKLGRARGDEQRMPVRRRPTVGKEIGEIFIYGLTRGGFLSRVLAVGVFAVYGERGERRNAEPGRVV